MSSVKALTSAFNIRYSLFVIEDPAAREALPPGRTCGECARCCGSITFWVMRDFATSKPVDSRNHVPRFRGKTREIHYLDFPIRFAYHFKMVAHSARVKKWRT